MGVGHNRYAQTIVREKGIKWWEEKKHTFLRRKIGSKEFIFSPETGIDEIPVDRKAEDDPNIQYQKQLLEEKKEYCKELFKGNGRIVGELYKPEFKDLATTE